MEWNVFYYNINSRKITTYNIFKHGGFSKMVEKHFAYSETKEEFSEELKRSLMYFFWSKSEYEVVISPWCGGNEKEAIKVDIYKQVLMNWDRFVDYVWEHKK